MRVLVSARLYAKAEADFVASLCAVDARKEFALEASGIGTICRALSSYDFTNVTALPAYAYISIKSYSVTMCYDYHRTCRLARFAQRLLAPEQVETALNGITLSNPTGFKENFAGTHQVSEHKLELDHQAAVGEKVTYTL